MCIWHIYGYKAGIMRLMMLTLLHASVAFSWLCTEIFFVEFHKTTSFPFDKINYTTIPELNKAENQKRNSGEPDCGQRGNVINEKDGMWGGAYRRIFKRGIYS